MPEQMEMEEEDMGFLDMAGGPPEPSMMPQQNPVEMMGLEQIQSVMARVMSRFEGGYEEVKILVEEDKQDIKNFKENDRVRFFVGTPQTGGYGITLTQANTVIYYSNGYDLEKRMQSEDRAHRIGQKKTVTYVDIIAEDTVDTKIVKSLRKKINIASKVMGEELKSWI